ncbi:predicted protein [Sclerotinia sclerotiorum 1980 UF-70]|uniref:Uncharacterized protein n=1 Tax=Sclerotinia sclerotiorum (strain ATCC 18683 / 1980 / Ss-1) TaxID=665079 RepID=A7EE64_SCLS1|nr:predicted protein [Sclerotinia sclerotiorum 1980 UF-70]EDO01130.1 predicted protein [Sclerotinia sclerotiorum 1980 UF-70]
MQEITSVGKLLGLGDTPRFMLRDLKMRAFWR